MSERGLGLCAGLLFGLAITLWTAVASSESASMAAIVFGLIYGAFLALMGLRVVTMPTIKETPDGR